jgi:hypothetical protein
MATTVTLNHTRIRQITRAVQVSLEQTAEAMHTDVVSASVIPFDKGTLQNVSTFIDKRDSKNGVVRIVHTAPYARRLYYHPEYNFQKRENANAQGLWWQPWIDGAKKNFAQNTFKTLFRRNANL